MTRDLVIVKTIVIKDQMKYNGKTVLAYRIEYPQFKSSLYQMSLVKINKFYKTKAIEYQKYCENELFKMAVEQYKDSIENNYPVRVFEALVKFNVTYNSVCIISLYFDKYEYTGGAHGNTIRYSQTWNLQKYQKIRLSELFGCSLDYKNYIFKIVKEQIQSDPSIYFEDYEKLLVETFNEDSFYCNPYGIVIYYQQYDIAPYSSGIREFLIPYTDCVINPRKKCFAI